MDVVLILTTVVFAILVIIASIYFLAYFQHPDDKWIAWFPKVVVVRTITAELFAFIIFPAITPFRSGIDPGIISRMLQRLPPPARRRKPKRRIVQCREYSDGKDKYRLLYIDGGDLLGCGTVYRVLL